MPQEISSGAYSSAYQQKLARSPGGGGGSGSSLLGSGSSGGGLLGGLLGTVTSPLKGLTGGLLGGSATSSNLLGGSGVKSDASINKAISSMDKQLANVGVSMPDQLANATKTPSAQGGGLLSGLFG